MKNLKKTTQYIFLALIATLFDINETFAHFGERSPTGGSVTVLVVEPNYNVLYLGTKSGGTYYMATPTATGWSRRNTAGLKSGNITSITTIGNTTTGLYIIAGTSDAGVFVSSDRGVTWTSTTSGLTNQNINALYTVGSVVLAGTKGGIFVSTNNGASFTAAATQPTDLNITSFANDGGLLYAGTSSKGVFRSSDNGITWTDANNTVISASGINSLAVANNSLVAGTNEGVYVAVNQLTANWALAITGITNTTVTSIASNGNIWYAGTRAGVFSSTDSGVNWTVEDIGYTGAVQTLAIHNNNLYVGVPTGVFRKLAISTTGTSFNTGIYNVNTYALYNSGTLSIVANENGVYVSTTSGSPVTSYVAASGFTNATTVNTFAKAGTKLYAGTKFDGIFESSDNGFTWTAANTGLPSGIAVNEIAATKTRIIAVLTSGATYSSPLGTISWTAGTGTGLFFPTGIATDSVNAFVSYISDGVYVSTNGGLNWTPFKTGLPTSAIISSIAVNGTNVYVGTSGNGIWKTSVLTCPSWSALTATIPSQNITSMGSGGKWIVAGFKGGVTASPDNGTTWEEPTNLWIPDWGIVKEISFTAANASDRINVVVPTNGVYSNGTGELPGYSTVAGANSLAANSVIYSCNSATTGTITGFSKEFESKLTIVPNPNNGSFTISLSDEENSLTSVTLINCFGQLVDTFTSRSISLVINESYNPGIYFAKISTSKGDVFKRIVIE
ncbi:MAG: T9SS type A sorting domain-containing protein [Bacteroidota bacterium]|nr:T9SS type A sorting domain-containing protein [Bacteroidota bacterium]